MSQSRSKLPLYLLMTGGLLYILGFRLWAYISLAIGAVLLFKASRASTPTE